MRKIYILMRTYNDDEHEYPPDNGTITDVGSW